MRTEYAGLVDSKFIGQTVTLFGWVHRRRDHGGVIFIDLRDREGLVQVVCDPDRPEVFGTAEKIRNEFCVKVGGLVRARPEGTANANLVSGQIEVLCQRLEILNPSVAPPFQLDDEDLSEVTRLTHRVLDLRRPQMQKNLMLRYKTALEVRKYLDGKGFVDIETPMLTKSTPEGARDYLVPSRVHDGMFFALPQSPQLFKQLLMVAGFDRYYQITKCFRDEDLRADRQPEFTQIDCETSFLGEEEIRAIFEDMVRHVFKAVLQVELPPFPVMTYDEAMRLYGSDKPDLRVGLQFTELTDAMRDVDFKVFRAHGLSVQGWRPLWVIDFPSFEYDEEADRFVAAHHPFTSPKDGHEDWLETDPARCRAKAYDMVLNGIELGGGSVRIHAASVQEKVFRALKIGPADQRKKFGFLLDALQYGAPPHGGIALGLDRFVMLMAGADSLRDVIAFPKTQRAQCLLTQAPSEVDEKQLRELHIKLRNPPQVAEPG